LCRLTVTNDGTAGIVNLDLDGNDRILGIELVGVSRIMPDGTLPGV